MSRKPKYKEGMVVHPGPGERVADVVIIAILAICMFIAIVPMWHTVDGLSLRRAAGDRP